MKTAVIIALAVAAAGCTTSPVDYASSLSTQDPKWPSPQCQQARRDASDYAAREKENPGVGLVVFGPYGLALMAAVRDHEKEQRKAFAREVHLQCSSLPLPKDLETATVPRAATKYP